MDAKANPRPANPPLPTSKDVLNAAGALKKAGLRFDPAVGCFVWDPDGHIAPDSPFPNRVYMILSLHRFLQIFGTEEAIAEKLIWVPTEHQVRRLLRGGAADGGNDIERQLQSYLDLLVSTQEE